MNGLAIFNTDEQPLSAKKYAVLAWIIICFQSGTVILWITHRDNLK